jgi:quinol monooxygenase YgiN
MAPPAPTKSFIVIAEFQVKPDCITAFLKAAKNDAEASLASEPGCRQFDIIAPQTTDGTIVFYEVYGSRAAFDAHLKTPHVDAFRKAFPPLIAAERPVRFADRLYP